MHPARVAYECEWPRSASNLRVRARMTEARRLQPLQRSVAKTCGAKKGERTSRGTPGDGQSNRTTAGGAAEPAPGVRRIRYHVPCLRQIGVRSRLWQITFSISTEGR